MSIIKELDEWLKHWSESKEKEININDTTIVFTKSIAPLRVNVSVVRDEEITNYNHYMTGEAIKAISILRCLIQIIYYHSQSLNNAVKDIKSCMEGEE